MNKENELVSHLVKFCNTAGGAALVGFVVIFAGLVNFTQFNHYPLFSLGILLNISIFLVVSVLMAAIYDYSPQSIKNFLVFLLGVFGLGLYGQTIWGYLLLLILYMTAKNKLLVIYAVLSISILVTSPIKFFLASGNAPSQEIHNTSDEPFILHLVMDEYIGLKGLGSYAIDTRDAKEELRKIYNKNGFSVFEGAYSKQAVTVNSLPIILNFGNENIGNNGFMNEISLTENKYFDLLENKGYKIRVFQSDWIDYCQHPAVITCETTLRSGPMPAYIDQANLTLFEKAWVAGYPFLSNSPLVRMLFTGLDKAVLLLNKYDVDVNLIMAAGRHQLISPYGLSTLEQLNKALADARPGQMYFSHAIFPHSPYIFDKNCDLKTYDKWADHSRFTGTREHRESANIEQNFCATRHLVELVHTLQNSAVKDNFIMIVHGDHGSRITEVVPEIEGIDRASEDDIIKSFSTLFMIKYAQPEPMNIEGTFSVDSLLGKIANNGFLPVGETWLEMKTPMVHINDDKWQPRTKIPLPAYK